MIFDDNSPPNFKFDDPRAFYDLVNRQGDAMGGEEYDFSDIDAMQNPDNHPDWAKEINQKYGINFNAPTLEKATPPASPNIPELFNQLAELKNRQNLTADSRFGLGKGGFYGDNPPSANRSPAVLPTPSPSVNRSPSVLPTPSSQVNRSPAVLPTPSINRTPATIPSLPNIAEETIGNEINQPNNSVDMPNPYDPDQYKAIFGKVEPGDKILSSTPVKSADNLPPKNNQQEQVSPQAPQESEATKEAADKIQNKVNNLKLLQMILEGSSELGAGISGAMSGFKVAPIKTDMFSKMAEDVEQGWKTRMGLEKFDPKSAQSSTLRAIAQDLAKKLGRNPDFYKDMPAAQLDSEIKAMREELQDKAKTDIQQSRYKTEDEFARQRLDIARKGLTLRETGAERALSNRQDSQLKRAFYSWKKGLPTLGGPAANIHRNRIAQAGAIFGTFGKDRDISLDEVNKLSNKELGQYGRMVVTESSIELNKLLSGAGAPSQKTLEKIVPKNILMDATKLQDYFNNKLNPAEQADFIRQVLKIAVRVRDNAQSQLVDVYRKDAQGRSVFWNNEELGPDFDASLKANGLTNEQINEIKYGTQPGTTGVQGMRAAPGTVVEIEGKKYRVAADGENLEEIK